MRRATAVFGLVAAAWAGSSAAPAAATDPVPSIVLIVTDDQRAGAIEGMPTVMRELAGRGVRFDEAIVSNPLCCPSRASILTGRYAHATGVYRQIPPYGRYEWFDPSDTIATRLRDAGYTTGLFGKYLDGYQHAALTGVVPPGWDRWVAFVRSAERDYRLTIDGVIVDHGEAPDDHATDVLAADAAAFVRTAPGPLFVVYAPPAPHAPSIPADRHADAPVRLPDPSPAIGERDVGDKPGYIRSLPVPDAAELGRLDELARRQARSLLAVDDGVAAILDALRDTGRLRHTLVLYTSDNGLLLGEHRWSGKEVPYEESIRVPLVLRYDPITSGRARVEDALVANIDLAPTIADVADVPIGPVDGRSLVPALRGPPRVWRDAVLLEHLRGTNPVPTYCGLRTPTFTFVRYETGERELYDLDRDPFQLENRIDDPVLASTVAHLERRLAVLCDPPPPGMQEAALAPVVAVTGVLTLLLAAGVVAERHRVRGQGW
jgi:arylsulfatase A-like enzyme